MMPEVAGVINPNHTKLSTQFQPWNCWTLCWMLDVKPPLFTLLHTEMLTDGAGSGRCGQPLIPRSHRTFHLIPTVKSLGRCWWMALELAGVINPSAKELRKFIQWDNFILFFHFFLGVSPGLVWADGGWKGSKSVDCTLWMRKPILSGGRGLRSKQWVAGRQAKAG